MYFIVAFSKMHNFFTQWIYARLQSIEITTAPFKADPPPKKTKQNKNTTNKILERGLTAENTALKCCPCKT